jgi:hypothetical protein
MIWLFWSALWILNERQEDRHQVNECIALYSVLDGRRRQRRVFTDFSTVGMIDVVEVGPRHSFNDRPH